MSSKKKSGKKGKLSKMTDEEKILYMEQKLLAEEEMKKKKQEMLAQFLKDKLAKEEKSTQFNMNKLDSQWRAIMREAKTKELKKDTEILSQTFERVVDRKDAILRSLVKDIEEAEEQYQVALRNHLENINNLIDLQADNIFEMEREYTIECEDLKDEFEREREKLIEQHRKETNELMDIMFAMDSEVEEKENEAKQGFQSIRDEMKNKNLEEKHALRIQLEGQVEDLWKQFQAALKNYNETTEERKNAFEILKAKDEKSAKEIEMQTKKLQKIQDSISQLKSKMNNTARECDEENRTIKKEKDGIAKHYQELKGNMNQNREKERQRLTKLTLQSNTAIKELKRKKEKGEKILKLAEMCRKSETEQEKVLPFYASSLTDEEEKEAEGVVNQKADENLANLIGEYTSLENFWKRYNKVLLDKLALEKKKSCLTTENQQLRSILKQYLDGISVSEEILSQRNPLLIVNNKTNIKLPSVPVGDKRVGNRPTQTVVEAAHIVKHTL